MIKFAEYENIPSIMRFIDEHWKKNHILARDRVFFEYQYRMGKKVNFVISQADSGEINGILGFIPYGKKEKTDIMLALWKVVHTDNPLLGVDLLQFLADHINARIIACSGINKRVMALYQWLGYHVGELIQWYRLGSRQDYHIAKINNATIPKVSVEQWSWSEFNTFRDFQTKFNIAEYSRETVKPYKEPWYIRHRYFYHPVYRYRLFGLHQPDGAINTVLVFRVQEYQSAKALRLIDCIGKPDGILHATALIDRLLSDTDSEYADVFEVGIPDELLLQAGWIKVSDSGNIIPDYFAPFVRENVKIYYCSTDSNIVLFKGDGDQDRPS